MAGTTMSHLARALCKAGSLGEFRLHSEPVGCEYRHWLPGEWGEHAEWGCQDCATNGYTVAYAGGGEE